ncbi:MAG: polyketide synthase dehydratase domain-containing protein, partial [Terriglobia bacterium]
QAYNIAVVPATACLEMVSSAAKVTFGSRYGSIEGMDIREALVLPEGQVKRLQLVLMAGENLGSSFQLARVPRQQVQPAMQIGRSCGR